MVVQPHESVAPTLTILNASTSTGFAMYFMSPSNRRHHRITRQRQPIHPAREHPRIVDPQHEILERLVRPLPSDVIERPRRRRSLRGEDNVLRWHQYPSPSIFSVRSRCPVSSGSFSLRNPCPARSS